LQKENSTLALISADFCLQNARSAQVYVGQVNAYRRVVTTLIEETAAIRRAIPNIGVIWITHFPPLLDGDRTLRLLGARRLLDAARQNGVRHVVAGHLHRNQVNTYSDVEVICTGTASSNSIGELYGFWIQTLDIDVDSLGDVSIVLTKFRYKNSELAFIRQG
jgi:hypothetical protein